MSLFANKNSGAEAPINWREISKICLGNVELYPKCTFHPQIDVDASDDEDGEFHNTREEVQEMVEWNTKVKQGRKEEKLDFAFTSQQQEFMNQLAEMLLGNE